MATCFDEDWEPLVDFESDYHFEEPFGWNEPPTLDNDLAGSTGDCSRSCMFGPLSELFGSRGGEDERRQQYLEGVFSMVGRATFSASSSSAAAGILSAPAEVSHVLKSHMFDRVDQSIAVLTFQAYGVVVAIYKT